MRIKGRNYKLVKITPEHYMDLSKKKFIAELTGDKKTYDLIDSYLDEHLFHIKGRK